MRPPSALTLRSSWLCDPAPPRLFPPERVIAPLETVAALRGQTPEELAGDLGLDEAFPLGALESVPTNRDAGSHSPRCSEAMREPEQRPARSIPLERAPARSRAAGGKRAKREHKGAGGRP